MVEFPIFKIKKKISKYVIQETKKFQKSKDGAEIHSELE